MHLNDVRIWKGIVLKKLCSKCLEMKSNFIDDVCADCYHERYAKKIAREITESFSFTDLKKKWEKKF